MSIERSHDDILNSILFPKISAGKTILLLGAGASVTDDKKYLSSDIIENYSRYHSLDYGLSDIVEFVDTLSADQKMTRRNFDDFVFHMLEKLKPTKTHEVIVTIPWREIITTNLDLLVEQAYDSVRGTPRQNSALKLVRDVKEESYFQALDEMRYVKLNGCASSRDAFPFVFSSRDFERVKPFYKKVLTKMRSLSSDIEFISIGYSYSDPFAKYFLTRFDEFARAGRRRLYNIDPYVPEGRIPYFEEQGIDVLPFHSSEFFEKYTKWLDGQSSDDNKRRGVRYYDLEGKKATLPPYLVRKLADSVRPLNPASPPVYTNPTDYYCGQEPTLDVIRQDLDVENKELEKKSLDMLEHLIGDDNRLVPIMLVVGEFGIGKSTFLFRLIVEAIKLGELNALAFEVMNPEKLDATAFNELVQKTGAKTALLLVENIEADSSYRAFRQLHGRLSMEQFSDFKVVMLSSIRENILERFQRNSALPETTIVRSDRKWKKAEILELVSKLETMKLVDNIDARTRNQMADRILEDYDGDLFVSLVSILKDSDHGAILRDAIDQLSDHAQKTLIFTSLLNQHRIKMPLGLIRSLIGLEWNEVSEQVLRVDFKGLVTTEEIDEPGLQPDTYLQIRHRRIAELIVTMFYPNEEQIFKAYKELVGKLDPTSFGATLFVDLLKAIRQKNHLSQTKINSLFDVVSQKFELEAHFVIHYSMNLERRGTNEALLKAIDEIKFLTSTLGELQNDRLIHRRAVATAKLAMSAFRDSTVSQFTFQSYVNDAEVWFERKRILDPLSHYSYFDYIDFEIWSFRHLNEPDDVKLQRRVRIAELFEQAESQVTENLESIQQLKIEFFSSEDGQTGEAYLQSLDRFMESELDRPYALVLKYYYFVSMKRLDECERLIPDLERFSENSSVASVLFRHYGKSLYRPDDRIRFWTFLRLHPELEAKHFVRFNFYLSIMNAYDRRFNDARGDLRKITDKYRYFNRSFEEVWRDARSGEPQLFEGVVVMHGKKKFAHLFDLQYSFPIGHRHVVSNIKTDDRGIFLLKFYPYGIIAFPQEIVKPS